MDATPAGFWIRVWAVIIDTLIVLVISFILTIIFQDPLFDIENSISANVFGLFYNIVFVILFTASQFKGSPGKIFAGIEVVTEAYERISLLRSIGRFFATILSGIILGIGYIMVAFTEEKKALHDIICNTRVIYKDD